MATTENVDLRYPIGKLHFPQTISSIQIQEYIADIALLPQQLTGAVNGLTPAQLDTPYRPGGWTVRQVVHHVPDSHMNGYVRFKMALTENNPLIKPYDENAWAQLYDTQGTPVDLSLNLLESLHHRWVLLLQSLSERDVKRTYHHPDTGLVPLEQAIALYAWHGKHHVAHITSLRSRMGWV